MSDLLERATKGFTTSLAEDGTVTGIAWPADGMADRAGDRISGSAFRHVKAPLPILAGHDHSKPIGTWHSIRWTAKGLEVQGRLELSIPEARQYRALAAAGGLALSIGGRFGNVKRLPNGEREVGTVDLMEVSLVPVPANPGAAITSVKSASDIERHFPMDESNTTDVADTTHITATIDALKAELDATTKSFADLKADHDRLATRLNRPGVVAAKAEDPAVLERKATDDYVRKGIESKALNTTDSADGGVLVPPSFEASLLRKIEEQSPFMSLATTVPVGANSYLIPVEDGLMSADDGWVDEQEEATETAPTFDKIEIEVNELAKFVNVGNRMIDDGFFDILGYLEAQFATKFSQTLNKAFLTGNGVKKPVGLLADNTVGTLNNEHAATVDFDKLIELYYGMPSVYRANGAWVMNAKTLGVVRKLALAHEHAGLFGENLAVGAPATLLGKPIVEMADMPDVAANATPIAFGSLRDAYTIVNRKGLSFLRDPYSQAGKRITTIHATMRIGGGVVRGDAVKLLKMAVTA